jgi:hypothetical protein
VTPPASLQVLLSELVDYAGLFPPAGLDMSRAVDEYVQYRHGPDHQYLGRFVVPVSRLAEFEKAAQRHLLAADPWAISALTATAIADDVAAALEFNARHSPGSRYGAAAIDTLEAKANSIDEVAAIERAVPADISTFVEVAPGSRGLEVLRSLRGTRLRAKIRTGGVVESAFPKAEDIVQFLSTCVHEKIPFKATAGLHHPIRGDYRLTYEATSEKARMYGFLNVFLCAALLHAGAPHAHAGRLLCEEDIRAFHFDDTGVRWDGHHLSIDLIRSIRQQVALSFGSCSFREPVGDLRASGLL